MINVNQLTAQLRMLPDAALQRVAMMYKNDPYILPMVISEDMARKKLRAAGQAQAAQPQPKVADQAIMAMAPQEAGIAQLPAPNMQNMADGGIAGQADDMEFAERSEPVVRMAEGGVPGYQAGGQPRLNPYIENLLALDPDVDEQGLPRTRRESEMIRAKQKEALEKKKEAEAYAGQLSATVPTEYRERMDQFYRPRRTPEQLAGGPVATVSPPTAPAAALSAAPGTAPGAGAGTPPLAPSAGTGAGAAPKDGGIYSLAGRLFDPIEERTQQQLRQMREGATRRGEAERKAFEEGKPKTKVGEGLEALLKKEAEGEAGEREQAKAMAIFNAGLAMMAGGSPRALENIAKGAMVGSGQYAEAIKDFKKAGKERQKMLASIEEARRAEARDDNKTALALMQRANDAESKMEAFALDATTTLGFKKADLTGRLYGTQMEIGARERLGRLPSADVQLIERIAQEKKIPFSQAFEYVRNTSQDPRTRQQLMKDWSESLILQQKYKTAKEYADAQMGTGGGLSGAGIDLSQWGNVQKVGG